MGLRSITAQEWEEAERAALEYCKALGTTPEELQKRELESAMDGLRERLEEAAWRKAHPAQAARVDALRQSRWEKARARWLAEDESRVLSLPDGCFEENGVIYQYTETP